MTMKLVALRLAALWALVSVCVSTAAAQSELPLLRFEDLEYQGAFRLPADRFGESEMNFSEGPIAFNPLNGSIFVVGHSHQQAIAEFEVPGFAGGATLEALPMANAPLQSFATVLDRAPDGNPQEINRVGGLLLVEGPSGPQLLVNGYEYYDAPGDNSHTTLVVRDPGNLASSPVDGYFSFTGGAGHCSGWMSPIPAEWQSALGGSHITGQSSGIPIISRTSVGPSAFVFDPLDIIGRSESTGDVDATALLDFSLDHPLADDLSNGSGENDLWTHLSRVVYGFVVPATRTYLTIGYSGGHESGVCYKCTQSNGNLCGGYCSADSEDNYHYYWLWDVNDLVAVKEGRMQAYEPRPYARGKVSTPFPTSEIGGGAFDPESGLLYLTIQRADDGQGQYANPPVIAVYRVSSDISSEPETALIGRLGKRRFLCVLGSEKPMVRIDRNGVTGDAFEPSRAISAFENALKRARSRIRGGAVDRWRKRKRAMRLAVTRARQCASGQLHPGDTASF